MSEVNNTQFKNLRKEFATLEESFSNIEKINSIDDISINDGKYGVEELRDRLSEFIVLCKEFLLKYKEGFLDGVLLRQKDKEYKKMINKVNIMRENVENSLSYVDEMLRFMKE